MYAVSNAYKVQMKKSVQQRKLRGMINEVVPFTDDDILDGSFTLTNQCMDNSSFGYGGVYVAELHLTFVTARVYDRKNWKGKRLFIEDGLFIDSEDNYEYIPLGHFRVAEANYTTWGLEIKAYDLMSKFDQPFVLGLTPHAVPFDLATLACSSCNIPMHLDRTAFNQVAAFPTQELMVSDAGIATWRDFLSYLCQACNMYCTMARDGSLDFRKIMPATESIVDTPTDTISTADRFGDGSFSDFTTSYTGITATFAGSQETVSVTYGNDKGVVIDIGVNPLLQEISEEGTALIIAQLEGDISRTETVIGEIDEEIDTLDDQIEEVEQEIHDHPDDPELPKLLEQLQKTKEDKESEKREMQSYLETLQGSLEEIQTGLADRTMDALGARIEYLATDLQSIQYNPATVSMLGDPAYDLGDVLRFTGGIAGGQIDLNIMRYDYTFGDRYTIETFGDAPTSNGSPSKDAKQQQAKDQAEGKGTKIQFVEYVNAQTIRITKNSEQEVARVSFELNSKAEVETWIELKMKVTKLFGRAGIMVNYYLDNELISAYHPIEIWEDQGTTPDFTLEDDVLVFDTSDDPESENNYQTVNFHYHLRNISSNQLHYWKVTVTGLDGVEFLDTDCVRLILWAQGMKEEGAWTGLIQARDTFPLYPIGSMGIVGDLSDDVNLRTSSASDNITTEDGDALITESGDNLTLGDLASLPNASTLDGTEYIPIVQNGETVKVTTQDLADLNA